MAGKNTAVFGLYRDEAQLNDGVDALRGAGYRKTDISVLFPNNEGTKDFAHEKHSKAPEGMATGGLCGMVIGATAAWLASSGILVIPGLAPYLVAGPIVTALAGAGTGGAIGWILGAIIGLMYPEYEARRYEGRVRRGSILMSVHCDNADWVGRAKHILKDTGAVDIASAGEKSADFANFDKPALRH